MYVRNFHEFFIKFSSWTKNICVKWLNCLYGGEVWFSACLLCHLKDQPLNCDTANVLIL